MLFDLSDGGKLEVFLGCYETEIISLKNLIKIEVDGVDIGFSGFLPVSSDDEHSFMQRKYKLLESIQVGKRETTQIAVALKSHIAAILSGVVDNPTLNEKHKSPLFSFFDTNQSAAIAAIIYNMKLRKGHSAVVWNEPFLTVEELVFLEGCLKISPYLKTKEAVDLTVADLAISVKAAYSEILRNRNGVDSLMALGGKELAVVYSDIPIVFKESDDYPL